MNEQEMESLLRSLSPAGAPPALEARVEREISVGRSLRVIEGAPTARMRAWLPVAWASLGAAAAVIVLGVLESQPRAALQPGTVASGQAAPAAAVSEPIFVDDQGVRFNEDKLPERHLKFVSLERREWVDPRDGARISVEVPREETLVMPVEFQ